MNRALILLFPLLAGCPWVTPTELKHRDNLDSDAYPVGLDCNETDPAWPKVYYVDADGDGYGDPNKPQPPTCEPMGAGYVLDDTDCDDTNPAVHPGATEKCDGRDDNCNGMADDGLTFVDWYLDRDGDGYGYDDPADPADNPVSACAAPAPGWVDKSGDCDDTNPNVYPGAPEICDGIVDSCTVTPLPSDEADVDGDHYVACAVAEPFADNWKGLDSILGGSDCNDNNPNMYPGAPEICDGYADDCSGVLPSDEIDDDDDGYVECAFADGVTKDNWGNVEAIPVVGGGDCDDTNPDVYPGATEICGDHVINDCTATYEADKCLSFGQSAAALVGAPPPQEAFAAAAVFSDSGDAPAGCGAAGSCAVALGVPADGTGAGAVYIYDNPPLDGSPLPFADSILTGSSNEALGSMVAGDPRFGRLLVGGALNATAWPYVVRAADLPSTDSIAVVARASFTSLDTIYSQEFAAVGDFGGDAGADYVMPPAIVYGSQTSPLSGSIGYSCIDAACQLGPDLLYDPGGAIINQKDAALRMVRFGDLVGGSNGEGDGHDDLIFCQPDPSGTSNSAARVYLVPHQTITDADLDLSNSPQGSPPIITFTDTADADQGDHFGFAAWPVGDFNGDGKPDLLITAPLFNSGGGKAFLIFGPFNASIDVETVGAVGPVNGMPQTPGLVLLGDPTGSGDELGAMSAMASPYIGDINGDGFADLAIGIPGANNGHGRVAILYGTAHPGDLCDPPPPGQTNTYCEVQLSRIGHHDTTQVPGFVINGSPDADAFGGNIVGADLNGDGVSELIVVDTKGTGAFDVFDLSKLGW